MAHKLQLLWFGALLGLFVSCLSASWLINAQFHYGYSLWYDWLNLGAHIQQFGPENYYKQGFEQLAASEHIHAFNEISNAVHQHGQGLADISYSYQNQTVPLLTQAEIIHLQDVANLIDVLRIASAVIVLFTGLLLWRLRRQSPPHWKAQLLLLLGFIVVSTVAVLMVGAEKVFYQLHIWIFPEGHQWFFYYQESLMSTMMKAPDLFAGIAVAILAGAMLLFLLLIQALRKTILKTPALI